MIRVEKVAADMNVGLVEDFLRRLTREGPLGNDILTRLEYASVETRRLCGRLAGASGYPNVGRKVEAW